ncbi:Quinol monooxygenase YgiN [Quadrisphaera granulorum]|uniref:Quinol monooxygenase YgiN n=1 Tax=Quadrisphaera granulorum TaxID=317664 RepID=A0A316AA52_9ACTN|nr:antibiotic biosynthesis monooxygenase family protein [Quadrisphaera granulorum]PWJ54655.1 quinol monooxygenase YgiN [Quadrisphaera granulorum]SZE96017.1 Quinol monooxygenase YgiN [Quadrisphaera granulorum]
MNVPAAVDLIATIDVPRDHLAQVLEMLEEYGDVVRSEPGNQRFEVYSSDAADHSVVVVERYVSQAAFQEHLDHPANTAFNRALGELLGGVNSKLEFLRAQAPASPRAAATG